MKKWIIIISISTLLQCSLYNIATEESSFSKEERPKADEGIAVFYFESVGKVSLPHELYFRSSDKQSKSKHFTLSAFLNNKKAVRYIFLKKGKYTFESIAYKFNGQFEGYAFPINSFTILPNRINYIGDILINYKRRNVKVTVRDKMNLRLAEFYPKYPRITIEYPKIKSLIDIKPTLEDWENKLYHHFPTQKF